MKKYLKMILATLILVIGIVSVNISASADELIGNPVFKDIYFRLGHFSYTGSVTVYNKVAEDVGDIFIAIYNKENGAIEQISNVPIVTVGGTQTFTCELALKKAGTYTAKMFVWDNKLKPISVITLETDVSVAVVEGFAVVTSMARTIDARGNDAYSITVVRNGMAEAETILVTADTLLADEYASAYNGKSAFKLAGEMSIGSVLNYAVDESGFATSIAPIANVSNNIYVPVEDIDLTGNTRYGEDTYICGITNDRFDGNDIHTNSGLIEVESFSNKYRVNNANPRRIVIEVGSYKGGNVINAYNGIGNAVLARKVDGEVTDVITIDARVSNVGAIDTSAFSVAPLTIDTPDGYTVTATKKSYNVYDVAISTTSVVKTHSLSGSSDPSSQGKWVGFRVVAPADAVYAKGTFGGTDYGSVNVSSDGFIDFYVDANNPKDIATLTFYDASGDALTAEMIFNIDVSGVVTE